MKQTKTEISEQIKWQQSILRSDEYADVKPLKKRKEK